MCGIAGIADLNGTSAIDPSTLRGMAAMLRHRGPDQTGIYVDNNVGLAHNRLSIIDLRAGAQPMCNEDGTVWICYNGEVYNYPELRRMLCARGHCFHTGTDTEVLIHLYEERGEGFLRMLNGQFALALWDSRAGELLLARDRMGIRPLHYTYQGGRLIFGSEVKAILTVPGVHRGLDPKGLAQICTLWTTLPGRTAFEGVYEVPAAHYMRVNRHGMRLRRYWTLPHREPGEGNERSPDRIAAEVRGLLTDAVRIRLRADVPVGAYVSGGLDSSITAQTAARFVSGLRTFGVRFGEAAYDEGVQQRQVVDWLGTRHTEVQAAAHTIASAFPRCLWHIEKPILRTAPAPLFLLSQAVRNAGMKVVLTGEGADEVFGGYNIFREALVRRFWARHRESALRSRLAQELYPAIFTDPRMKRMLPSFVGRYLDHETDPLFSHLMRWSTSARTAMLFSADLTERIGAYDPVEDLRAQLPPGFDRWDTLSKAQYLETSCFMGTYLLSSQGDRVAMAHSVEIRLPFLDHRVVEYAAKVPSVWKVLGLREKHILKKAFAENLPPQIVNRPKFPYRAPVAGPLLHDPAGQMWGEVLSPSSLSRSGLFDARRTVHLIEKMRQRGSAGEVDAMALAAVASTMIVYEQFVSGFPLLHCRPLRELDVYVDRRSEDRRGRYPLTTPEHAAQSAGGRI